MEVFILTTNIKSNVEIFVMYIVIQTVIVSIVAEALSAVIMVGERTSVRFNIFGCNGIYTFSLAG